MPKSLIPAGGLLAACLLVTGATPAQARTPAATTLRTGPIFNSPVGTSTSQHAISAQIGTLIAGAPKGSVIYVAMYHFSTQDMAVQLASAKKRKVQVRVILDHESAQYKAYRTLHAALGGSTKKSSYVILCGKGHGCIGPRFNHNKFFLFSTTLHSKKVVVQTSANATYYARDMQWNDALTIKNAAVYAGYRHYFYDLAKRKPVADYHRVVNAGKYRLDFFPWSSSDPVSAALDSVSCAGGTRVRLMLGHFTWGPVAQRLWSLDDQGCRVQVFFSHVGKTVVRDLLKAGGRNGDPAARYLPEDGHHPYEHSKYLLIDGGYQGRAQKVVFAGSNNYTDVGFHGHDEAMITVADAGLEGRYATNFDAVFKRGSALTPGDAITLPPTIVERDGADDTSERDD